MRLVLLTSAALAAPPPVVLLLVTDQHRWDAFTDLEPSGQLSTPNFDRLAYPGGSQTSRCLQDSLHGLRGADRGDAAGRDVEIPRATERTECCGRRSTATAIERKSSHWMVWAHGLRGADRGDAAGRDVEIPRPTEDRRLRIERKRSPDGAGSKQKSNSVERACF